MSTCCYTVHPRAPSSSYSGLERRERQAGRAGQGASGGSSGVPGRRAAARRSYGALGPPTRPFHLGAFNPRPRSLGSYPTPRDTSSSYAPHFHLLRDLSLPTYTQTAPLSCFFLGNCANSLGTHTHTHTIMLQHGTPAPSHVRTSTHSTNPGDTPGCPHVPPSTHLPTAPGNPWSTALGGMPA